MARQISLIVALAAVMALNVVSAYGPYGMNTFEAGAANMAAADSARATGHALAAENSAANAMVDRAMGNPIGAAINENRAIAHSTASNVAATRSTGEAMVAGSMVGANMAAQRAVNNAALVSGPLAAAAAPIAAANLAAGVGMAGPYGYNVYPGYGAAYGYPAYAAYGAPGYVGPLGYGPGMNRIATGAAAAATGAAIANGLAGSTGMGPAMGVASRIAALA